MVRFPHTHILKLLVLFFSLLAPINNVCAGEAELFYFPQESATAISYIEFIESNSSYIFSYTNKIDLSKTISLSSRSLTLSQFLEIISKNCTLDYSIVLNKIILEPKRTRSRIIYGQVTSQEGNEWLIGAYIVNLKTMKAVTTNSYGYYSIKVEGDGAFDLGYTYLGYNPKVLRIQVTKDTLLNLKLKSNIMLDEVAIESEKVISISNSQMSAIMLNSIQIQKVPSFFGESDLVKTISLLPGISSGSEGFSGLNVRGGSSDQNLVLLDDVPLYGLTHMLGLFSVFNSDAINQVTVLKGGFPARYGGRASSVIDLKLLEGNNERLRGVASVGLSSIRLSFDGPLIRGKSTFSISLRRTFHDKMDISLPYSSAGSWNFYFYDLYGKMNHTFSERSRLFISIFSSKDNFYSEFNAQSYLNAEQSPNPLQVYDENSASWGNLLGSVRWNYILNKQLFMNTQIAYSRFRYEYLTKEYSIAQPEVFSSSTRFFSGVSDIISKVDFDYRPSVNHSIRFGINTTSHAFQPGIETNRQWQEADVSIDTIFGGKPIYGTELHGYIEDDWTISYALKANVGIRLVSYFAASNNYFTPEPRLSLRYTLTSNLVFKAAFSETSQYLHLVNSSSISLPTDLWFPVTQNVKPVNSELYSIGSEWNIFKSLVFSVEGYYKTLHNILEIKDGSGIYGVSSNLTDFLTAGEGRSKGVELFAQIKERKLQGWIGYSYSNTEHQFEKINNNIPFPARNDNRHSVSISTSFSLTPTWEFGLNWVYKTGSPITLPTQKYYSPTLPTPYSSANFASNVEMVSGRNSYRMSPYHRLDISMTNTKKRWWGERIWSFGIYNAYGHQNPFILYFKDIEKSDGSVSRQLQQLSIVPIPVPYIRFTAKF